ncbi:MAG: DUF4861 family protein, partial [Kiritimatiellae bacterium]|nr:DUF4861 family protein [Kiritimatiellia bacterium]
MAQPGFKGDWRPLFWLFEGRSGQDENSKRTTARGRAMIAAILIATTCLCGEAPERANDFFWENDRTGFRAYGP